MRRETDPIEPGRVSIESPTLAFPRLADARLPVRSDPLCQREHSKGSLALVSGPDGRETGAASFLRAQGLHAPQMVAHRTQVDCLSLKVSHSHQHRRGRHACRSRVGTRPNKVETLTAGPWHVVALQEADTCMTSDLLRCPADRRLVEQGHFPVRRGDVHELLWLVTGRAEAGHLSASWLGSGFDVMNKPPSASCAST